MHVHHRILRRHLSKVCLVSFYKAVPKTAPDPQQFLLAAALHSASPNKRPDTEDNLKAFLSTSFKTLCCTARCHLSFFPAKIRKPSFFRSAVSPCKLFERQASKPAHNPQSTIHMPTKLALIQATYLSIFVPARNLAAQAWLQPTH